MSAIKPKIGQCSECNDGIDKPLIAGRCASFHYWQYRRSLKTDKAPSKPRKAIKQVSDKQAKRNAAYSAAVKVWKMMEENKWCCFPGCTELMQDCHHPEGRLGDKLLNLSICKPLCREHHTIVESNPKLARELGLSSTRLK